MSTLCYIERDKKYLMIRILKENDVNKDKWIVSVGHLHAESPEECLIREVYEENGI